MHSLWIFNWFQEPDNWLSSFISDWFRPPIWLFCPRLTMTLPQYRENLINDLYSSVIMAEPSTPQRVKDYHDQKQYGGRHVTVRHTIQYSTMDWFASTQLGSLCFYYLGRVQDMSASVMGRRPSLSFHSSLLRTSSFAGFRSDQPPSLVSLGTLYLILFLLLV